LCSFLTNFLTALVPLSGSSQKEDVEEYFKGLSDSEIESYLDKDSDSSTD